MTRVLLVDDHAILRAGVRSLLSREDDISVVGEAATGREALNAVRSLSPHVVVMDIMLPDLNGIETARQLSRAGRCPRIVMLTAMVDRAYVESALAAGALGYVTKGSVTEELVRAVRAARQGSNYLCAEVAHLEIGGDGHGGLGSDGNPLTPREREVLQLVAEGLTTAAIAQRMFISVKTVEAHRRNIVRKLGLRTVAELTKYAVRHGISPA